MAETLARTLGMSLYWQYDDRQKVKELLSGYQNHTMNEFEQLDLLHKNIKEGRIDSVKEQELLFEGLVSYVVDKSYHICNTYEFLDRAEGAAKGCLSALHHASSANEMCDPEEPSILRDCVVEYFHLDVTGVIQSQEQIYTIYGNSTNVVSPGEFECSMDP